MVLTTPLIFSRDGGARTFYWVLDSINRISPAADRAYSKRRKMKKKTAWFTRYSITTSKESQILSLRPKRHTSS